jgi:hypothetical protein
MPARDHRSNSFPRPDEPLTVARQRAVTQAGGNGFMKIAASHAALLLAQGSGRLIRRLSDRGSGRRAGSAAGHGTLRRVPEGLDAGHVADHGSARRPSKRSAAFPACPDCSARQLAPRGPCQAARARSIAGGGVDRLARLRYGAHVRFRPGGHRFGSWRSEGRDHGGQARPQGVRHRQ